jgi:hypothetical protein
MHFKERIIAIVTYILMQQGRETNGMPAQNEAQYTTIANSILQWNFTSIMKPSLKFYWGEVNLNTKQRKILNTGNLTLRLSSWDH